MNVQWSLNMFIPCEWWGISSTVITLIPRRPSQGWALHTVIFSQAKLWKHFWKIITPWLWRMTVILQHLVLWPLNYYSPFLLFIYKTVTLLNESFNHMRQNLLYKTPTSFVYRNRQERQSKQSNLPHCPFPCDTRVLHASTQLMPISTGKGSSSSSMILKREKIPLSPRASFRAGSAP